VVVAMDERPDGRPGQWHRSDADVSEPEGREQNACDISGPMPAQSTGPGLLPGSQWFQGYVTVNILHIIVPIEGLQQTGEGSGFRIRHLHVG